MNQEKSKMRILQLWDSWEQRVVPATHSIKLKFYDYIEREHPELLEFRLRNSGDSHWQHVHGWINAHESK